MVCLFCFRKLQVLSHSEKFHISILIWHSNYIYVMSTFVDLCKIFQLLCTEVSNTAFTLRATQMENTEAWVDPRIVHLAFKKAKHQNTCMLDICLESIYAEGGKISLCWYFNKHAQLNKTTGQMLCIFTMSFAVPSVTVKPKFCATAEGYCTPRTAMCGSKNWNDVLQNNRSVCRSWIL